jgi:5'/3'-nucleotidase
MSIRDGAHTALYPRELPGIAEVEAWAVEGHPGYILHMLCRGWLDPEPDLVLSGMNIGAHGGHRAAPARSGRR